MTGWRIVEGDALERLRELPDGSVQCCITSPPYYGLRDYGTGEWEGGEGGCDHKGAPLASSSSGLAGYTSEDVKVRTFAMPQRQVCGKCGARRTDRQLGLESTPDEYVARLVEVFREVRRVLRADGTVWCNLGDGYAGSWGAQSRGGPPSDASTLRGNGHVGGGPKAKSLSAVQIAAHPKREGNTGSNPAGAEYKPKDLFGIPWLVAFALRADGWYLRSDIIWAKPNPMPESVTDRPTSAHEHVFLLAKSRSYFYDADAIREASDHPHLAGKSQKVNYADGSALRNDGDSVAIRTANRNRRNVWEIATQPYPEAHFATFPTKLVEPCVLAGSSPRACGECGAPWKRVVEKPDFANQPKRVTGRWDWRNGDRTSAGQAWQAWRDANPDVELGWQPCCPHDDNTGRSTILDPFAGSGTVGLVALRHDRSFIGIELSAAYCEMARNRIRQDAPLLNTPAETAA